MVVGRSRRSLAALGLQLAALIASGPWVHRALVKPITRERRPAALVDGPGDARFGLPSKKRREIFASLAASEPSWRRKAVEGYPGLPWSQEDLRAAFERDAVRAIAERNAMSPTQAYLVLDEGIRAHWLGWDGKPLAAQVTPLDPRKR